MIVDILRSRRIKLHTAEMFRPHFEKEIQARSKQHPMSDAEIQDFVIAKLKLKKNLQFDYNPARFTILLSYYNPEPKLAHDVVETYLAYLNMVNQELELSAEKELIKIIDRPFVPRFPAVPNLKKSLIKNLAVFTLTWGLIILYLVYRNPHRGRK